MIRFSGPTPNAAYEALFVRRRRAYNLLVPKEFNDRQATLGANDPSGDFYRMVRASAEKILPYLPRCTKVLKQKGWLDMLPWQG